MSWSSQGTMKINVLERYRGNRLSNTTLGDSYINFYVYIAQKEVVYRLCLVPSLNLYVNGGKLTGSVWIDGQKMKNNSGSGNSLYVTPASAPLEVTSTYSTRTCATIGFSSNNYTINFLFNDFIDDMSNKKISQFSSGITGTFIYNLGLQLYNPTNPSQFTLITFPKDNFSLSFNNNAYPTDDSSITLCNVKLQLPSSTITIEEDSFTGDTSFSFIDPNSNIIPAVKCGFLLGSNLNYNNGSFTLS